MAYWSRRPQTDELTWSPTVHLKELRIFLAVAALKLLIYRVPLPTPAKSLSPSQDGFILSENLEIFARAPTAAGHGRSHSHHQVLRLTPSGLGAQLANASPCGYQLFRDPRDGKKIYSAYAYEAPNYQCYSVDSGMTFKSGSVPSFNLVPYFDANGIGYFIENPRAGEVNLRSTNDVIAASTTLLAGMGDVPYSSQYVISVAKNSIAVVLANRLYWSNQGGGNLNRAGLNLDATKLSLSSVVAVGSTVYAACDDYFFKSADSGKTWTMVQEFPDSQNGRVQAHPSNPDRIYYAQTELSRPARLVELFQTRGLQAFRSLRLRPSSPLIRG